MPNIQSWNLIQTNKNSGTAKLKCPTCTDTRKNKTDRSLYVNFNNGIGKCFNCEALYFRDSIERSIIKSDYKLPEQTWKNYTTISDGFIKALESRRIRQSTIINFGITQETFYQPKLQKEVDNLVFNYFEGDVVVNKKYRGVNDLFA